MKLRPLVWTLIAFALLNAPYWWLGRTDFLTRPWFNVDLLIPLVMAARAPVLSFVVLLALWALDMAVSQALTWNFQSPIEFIRSIEFLPSIHLGGYLSGSMVGRMLLFGACGIAGLWLARRIAPTRRAVLLVFLGVAAVDLLNGSSLIWVRSTRPLPGNVAGSAVKMAVTAMLTRPGERIKPLTDAALTTQFPVLGWARAHPDRSILLFVIESMGQHKDPAMRLALRDSLVDPRIESRFDTQDYAVPFHGSTVDAELRELCGLQGSYRSLGDGAELGCLPHRLDELGWQTTGLHGFSHRMFMRGEWWPLVGLRHTLFAEDLTHPDQRRCGAAFVGICDAEVVRRAVLASRVPRSFVYAVTLNSHLPLETLPIPRAMSTVCDRAEVGPDVCALTAVLKTALAAIRDALAQESELPLVLIVGDHAPPFSLRSAREQFSETKVTGFVLVPKR